MALRITLASLLALGFCFGQNPNVDEIISKHLAAMGGVEKMRSIRSTKSTGKVVMGGGQMEGTMVRWSRRPGSQRAEISMQGMKIIQGFDGTTSWMVNPMMGSAEPQKLPEKDAQQAAGNTDPDGSPMIDYKAKGNKVELMGKEDVEGSMAYRLKITTKNGNVTSIFLDEKTLLPVKTIATASQMGQEYQIEGYLSNFKPVEGVMMPFTFENKLEGRSMMLANIDKIEVNLPLEDSLFSFPAPAPLNPGIAPVKK